MDVLLVLIVFLALAGSFMGGALVGRRRGSVPFISRPEVWAIGIYEGPSPSQLGSAAAANPVLTAEDVTDLTADFVADPFMIHVEGTWYMFFEVVNTANKRGEIALARSSDGLTWSYDRVVLREPFHLSYPYVFEWEDSYYMIPESRAAHSVRLYEASDFPFTWTPVATLLHEAYDDASVFRHAGRWWMLASVWHDVLRLFSADRLEGPWTEHPMSPLIENDARIARPAGRVVVHDGRVIRYAQDCAERYGSRVHAFEITELTTTRYAEQPASEHPVVDATGTGWSKKGMHHVDAHLVEGRWRACVDGYAGRKLVVDLPGGRTFSI